jgi:hypothetical protein
MRKAVRIIHERQEQFVGLAPPDTEARDLVCIIFGCSVPVVLRSTARSGEFKFVGECYVHGMMDGEAFDRGFRRSNTQTFRLI